MSFREAICFSLSVTLALILLYGHTFVMGETIMAYSSDMGLAAGWKDVSWTGIYDMHYRANAMQRSEFEEDFFGDQKINAIYASPGGFGGLSLHAPSQLNASSVSFYISMMPGADPSNLLLRLDTDKGEFRAQAGLPLSSNAATGYWQLVVMPLSKIGSEPWDRISIQDLSGNGTTFFVTDISLDVGPEAQAFNPFQTFLPQMWPIVSPLQFIESFPEEDFPTTQGPVRLYQNGIFELGTATWSWGGEFNYTAPSPTGAYHSVISSDMRKGGGLSIATARSFSDMDSIIFWMFTESPMALSIRFEESRTMDLRVFEAPLSNFAPTMTPGVWTMIVVPIPEMNLAWDRFSIVEAGQMERVQFYVDSLMLFPKHSSRQWRPVFHEFNDSIPLYMDSLMPGVHDYSWDVNHDLRFDLPDGRRVIRATARPFGAVSLKTDSPFAGMASLEFSIWLTIPTTSQYVPEVQSFDNETLPSMMDDISEWSSSIALRFDASVPQSDGAGSGGMYLSFPLSEIGPLHGGQWQKYVIPLDETNPEHAWDRISWMDTTGSGLSFFIDDVVLTM